ncbi:MAG: hypothetical protein ACE5H9_17720 [Anaerolineae bacterium]
MARKRASLKGKGPEILKRGRGVDALFGGGAADEAKDVKVAAEGEAAEAEGQDEALAALAAESDAASPPAAEEPVTEAAGEVAPAGDLAGQDQAAAEPAEAPLIEDLPSDEADLDLDELLDLEAETAGPGSVEEAVPPDAVEVVSPEELPPAMETIPPEELPPALEYLPPEELPQVEDLPVFEMDEEEALPEPEIDEGLAALAAEAGAAEPAAPAPAPELPSRPLPAGPPSEPAAPPAIDGQSIPAAAYTVPPPASTQPSVSRSRPLEIPEDSGVFDFTSTRREPEPVIFDSLGEELTAEQRAEKLKDQRVLEQFNQVYAAIDEQYQRILDRNASVSKEITDWAHNLLAEARYIILEYQVEHLARAEWNIEQVRARLDRAEESQRRRIYAYIISIWGLAWFAAFVAFIFRVDLLSQFLQSSTTKGLLDPDVFLTTLFFGGIGGVTAVFYHLHYYVSKRTYDISYNLSYIAKPFMGMILGTLVYIIVFGLMGTFGIRPAGALGQIVEGGTELTASSKAVTLFVWALALASGFKENLAFELLERIMKVIFRRQSGDDDADRAEPPPKPVFEGKE